MINLNDKKSKKEKSVFVLSDIIKRKILDIYKNPKFKKNKKKTSDKTSKKSPNIINNSKQSPNTK